MKRIFITLLISFIFIFKTFSQQKETIGTMVGSSYSRVSDSEQTEYNIIRSDKDGKVIWVKELITTDAPNFDLTLDLYMVYGYTTINNNSITNNPGDYDYWLVVKTKNIESFIYPNPTRGNVFVFSSDLSNNVRIMLFDMNGREVLRERLIDYTTSIKLPFLSQGTYFYKIENDNLTIKSGKLCVL